MKRSGKVVLLAPLVLLVGACEPTHQTQAECEQYSLEQCAQQTSNSGRTSWHSIYRGGFGGASRMYGGGGG